ncbi:MAG: glycosyltransferase N-terminal domain-containing protein [Bacteroidales bacterium]
MAFLYNLSIFFYSLLIHCAGFFNKKARLWIEGRKNVFTKIKNTISSKELIAWFHCASLGEFEQGRTVIEHLRKRHPEYKILLTFFSPSGYEVRKNYKAADYIFYLPLDTSGNAKRFLDIVKPSIVFFIKYEFWFNYIRNLRKKNIPFFVISANFRHGQHFFKWYGGWFRQQLRSITHIFVQNKESLELLKRINITQATVSGDTRFDRVYEITGNVKTFPVIQRFCEDSDVFVAGSSWPPDEEFLTRIINSGKINYKFIIAPHLVNKSHVASLTEKIKGHVVKYSEADEENVMCAKVLVIDCIGILSHVYRYGKIAYIGGGFGSGIHNILEAATFGLPVIFGPKYHKFQEAIALIKEGGAFSISSEAEFNNTIMRLYNNPDLLEQASEIAKNFVQKNIGATKIILDETDRYF